MVTGLADEDIRKEMLGWGSLDEKDVNETIGFIEALITQFYEITSWLIIGDL